MESAFREEHNDGSHAAAHEVTTARAAAGHGNDDGDTASLAALTNVSTAESDDHIVDKGSPVRREITREKLSRVASQSKEWSASHIKNKWKWYLLGLIIFLAILLPIVFTVVLPAVVQLIVNQQTLPISSGMLTVVDPDTIKITMNSSFHLPPGLRAKTNQFVLQLYDKSAPEFSPFLSLDLGPLTLKGGTTNFSIEDQVQKITNQESLATWFGTFFDGDKVGLSVRGTNATISLGSLKSHPRLDKTIEMQGLNGLRGIGLQNLNFLFPPQNGINIRGDLMLPNPSPLALSIGEMELAVMSGNLTAGTFTLKNLVIQPGNHTQSVEGFLDLNAIISNLSGFLSSQSMALGEGKLQLNATAKSILVNGEHVAFAEQVLSKRPLTVNISVVTVLADLISGLLKSGGVISGDGPANGTAFVDALSGVFGNQTLLSGIAGHWDKHAKRDTNLDSRSMLGDSTMWNLVKLGLKLKAMQK